MLPWFYLCQAYFILTSLGSFQKSVLLELYFMVRLFVLFIFEGVTPKCCLGMEVSWGFWDPWTIGLMQRLKDGVLFEPFGRGLAGPYNCASERSGLHLAILETMSQWGLNWDQPHARHLLYGPSVSPILFYMGLTQYGLHPILFWEQSHTNWSHTT